MAQKKKSVAKPAAAGETPPQAKRRPVNKSVKHKGWKQAVRKNPQPRVWRRVAKLAGDALVALEAGDLAAVRGCLEAVRAVGLCAEEE